MNLLAYGDYPVDDSGTLAIKRGVVQTLSPADFDQANIAEYVANSWYDYGVLDPASLHPFSGKTSPDKRTTGYSWIKSPRLTIGTTVTVCEVGPLARMVNNYVRDANSVKASENDLDAGNSLAEVLTSLGYTVNGGAALASYDVTDLVDATVGAYNALEPTGTIGLANLYSPLGRHAARALEAKYIADLIGHATSGWAATLNPANPCYTYTKIPKTLRQGYGLTEAPRGALGHWIKIEGKKTAKYQCVVPSTWNFGPAHGTTADTKGPVEQSLMDAGNIGTNGQAIINILRVVHPFDCCIACAVHVVSPEGKEKLRFAIGPDGRPTNIEIKE
jgi:Ni,Fe-hydrogenase I large subunit